VRRGAIGPQGERAGADAGPARRSQKRPASHDPPSTPPA
jgi:hypothetical protein